MANEFDLIARYFSRPAPDGYLGVGDDCALLTVSPGHQLATSTDLLIEGRHFFADVDPHSLGHKALAVNLSDLAAMGSQPLACLLSLSLPHIDHRWLAAFSDGFYALADEAQCPLVGGDTTRSVSGIVISVTVMGQVETGQALRRDAARPGDDIWVTGTLGAAHIALRLLQGSLPPNARLLKATRAALEMPMPPTRFSQRLAGLAHAALDISDGLAQDLGHILAASRCGARLHYPALPVDPALASLDDSVLRDAVMCGGDVYQLCFTAAAADRQRILALASNESVRATRIGSILAGQGLTVLGADDQPVALPVAGFDHFS
ncbi:MAG TPA: thiamine-phosphate kinase [Candidimonas sp.]|nr:thiamine-phosphate kinase [Candidimonas sp.]